MAEISKVSMSILALLDAFEIFKRILRTFLDALKIVRWENDEKAIRSHFVTFKPPTQLHNSEILSSQLLELRNKGSFIFFPLIFMKS